MKKILLSLLTVSAVAAVAFFGTRAFFSDTETSTGNVFTAGAVDLKIDSTRHYNGLVCVNDTWQAETGYNPGLNQYPEVGSPCTGSFPWTDLEEEKFFEFGDVKPGDWGENTISLHVFNNPAHACMYVENMVDLDNSLTEPESDLDTNDDGVGELSTELHFFAWDDLDGDNVWDIDEKPFFSNVQGPASDVLDGKVYQLPYVLPGIEEGDAASANIGLYWCYGALTVDEANRTLTCDGSGVSNMTQTDSLTADLRFYVEQARHNDNFVCPAIEEPWINAVGAINDESATDGEWYMRSVGDPAPAGYSHAYQWGKSLTCDPNNTPVVFNGTIDVNSMVNGNVAFIGLLDKGLLESGKTGYQSGAYLYVYKMNNGNFRIGPTDGNLGGEIVQVFGDYPIGDGVFDISMTIHNGSLSLSVDGGTPITDTYGDVKTLNNASPYSHNEFEYGAYFGWDNYESNTMPYDLTITGCN